ncbi:MAG: Copper-exporting P-type ATPase [Burkholderiaceae bacterium]|nr:Copper-exporting P-type ATPase [Burkholderiaceae bacterium]
MVARDDAPVAGEQAFFHVDGMHCASCERLISHVAAGVEGVLSMRACYTTGTAKVVYDPARIAESELSGRLSVAGYRFRPRGEPIPEYDENADLLRMLAGCCVASAVMMLSFVFVYPLHAGWVDPQDYAAIGWLAFSLVPSALFVLTTVQVFYVGAPILRGAHTALRVRGLNMDLLLALAFCSAYAYSVFQLWHGAADLYFDVASGVVAVVTIGRFLERGARETALREIGRFLNAEPARACVVRAGECFFCTADELAPGDRLVVREGETIPADGTIADGAGAVDESLLTGEPFPAARRHGDRVLGGAALREGRIEVDVGDRVRSRITELGQALWNAQVGAGGTTGRADRLAGLFVPLVLGLALLVGAGFLAAGAGPQRALLAALATLIVSCPCTFGLAIPLTLASATSAALQRGILVTRPELFDRGADVDIVAIDKTGTLSSGEMVVCSVVGPPEVASLAAAVERDSPHPVARAIAQLDRSSIARGVQHHPGRGASGMVGGRRVAVGSQVLFETLRWSVPPALAAQFPVSGRAGIVSYVGWDGVVHGAIVTRDQPRPQWESVVDRLRRRGRAVLLTGAASAEPYGSRFDEVFAGVPPEAKAAVVRKLRERGRVAMVGDGSNDAPALAEADVAVAFGAPTALAAQAAAIVVAGDRLDRVVDALDIVACARRRVRQNLGWALSYNAVAVPLAMTGLLNPLWAALAMTASSLLVVWNATRPLMPTPDPAVHDPQSTRRKAWIA